MNEKSAGYKKPIHVENTKPTSASVDINIDYNRDLISSNAPLIKKT